MLGPKWKQNPAAGALFALTLFDFIAATVIWYASMVFTFVLWNEMSGQPVDMETAVDRDKGLPFSCLHSSHPQSGCCTSC